MARFGTSEPFGFRKYNRQVRRRARRQRAASRTDSDSAVMTTRMSQHDDGYTNVTG